MPVLRDGETEAQSPGAGSKVTQRARHSAGPGSRALPRPSPTPSPARSCPVVSPPAPRGRAAARRRPRPGTRAGSGRKRTGLGSRCCKRGPRVGAGARSAGRRGGRADGGRSAAPASWVRVRAGEPRASRDSRSEGHGRPKGGVSRSGVQPPLLAQPASWPRLHPAPSGLTAGGPCWPQRTAQPGRWGGVA